MLPEMNTTEPYSPTARANASAKPVASAGQSDREQHAPERVPAAGAEARRGLLELGLEVLEHGLHRAHHERQADEGERHGDAERRVGDLDAERLEQPADPAVLREQRRERDARDRGRQRERQVDERVDEPRPGKR